MSDKYRTDGAGAEALAKQLSADERLQPGDSGYWEVWGARSFDVIAGDVVVTLDKSAADDASGTLVCEEIATSEDFGGVRQKYTTPSGNKFSLGHLFTQFKVFRQGTHNMLAKSI